MANVPSPIPFARETKEQITSMEPESLNDSRFDQSVALRDAYRIMERFVQSYLARGDSAVSDFLHTYAAHLPDGRATDPAALGDFLRSAEQAL